MRCSNPAPESSSRRRLVHALAVATLSIAGPMSRRAHADPLRTWPLRIRGHDLSVELADTPESRRTGLMFRRSLDDGRGMLFTYETPGLHAMWMRNTYIPLSVAFVDAAARIVNIEDMEPQTETPHAAIAPASWSIEVNRGWFRRRGIRAGDRVEGLDALPVQR